MPLPNLVGKRLILASASPRRQMLMRGLDIDFITEVRAVEEVYPAELKRHEVARYLAQLKANSFRLDLDRKSIILTADTTVYLDGAILNKPIDDADAIRMLQLLSGKTHTVITAVYLLCAEKEVLFHDETEVTFSQLTNEEIAHYVHVHKPLDKAGAYGAQDFIGYIGIKKLEGSYYNVMGLPVHKVYEALKGF